MHREGITMVKISNRMWMPAAVLAIALAGCAADGNSPSTGQYIDDSSITAKVKSGMIADKAVSARNISVVSTAGVVQLTGNVANQQEADRAVVIAYGVAGVKSVDNQMHITQ
jgi:hyperosmotically inducible protein